MPRGPRLDAPGVLHHVMVRGIERRAIVRDRRDRTDFVARVAALAAARCWGRSAGMQLIARSARPTKPPERD